MKTCENTAFSADRRLIDKSKELAKARKQSFSAFVAEALTRFIRSSASRRPTVFC